MKHIQPLAALAFVLGAAPALAEDNAADIVVTATRRDAPLADVPIAITAVSAQQLAQSGASDIRQLNQLAPSLLVSSTSSEAGGGGARIRGIGTVGDNAGLESSVATFVDGVYRDRSAIALTELGPLERIEVLRGPQGTLFGRNASAGLINIVTAQPRFTQEGYGEIGFGNYASKKLAAGLTGPVTSDLAYRIDGVWQKRDGFIDDTASGRSINNRDRWLARGKLLWKPHDGLSLLLAADYSRRHEECCVGTYLTAQDVTSSTPGVGGGTLIYSPSSIAALMSGITSALGGKGVINDNTYARSTTLSPGRTFRQDVRDGGVSAELNADLGGARLTSISAYRANSFIKGQDADFTSLDLIVRPSDGSGYINYRTFSQELRLQGQAFGGKVNWLVGGYYSDERLHYADNIAFGQDFETFAAARMGAASAALAPFPQYGFTNLTGFARAFAIAQLANGTLPAGSGATVANAIAGQVVDTPLNGTGENDRYRQRERNVAIFTHDIIDLTDRLSLTLGARYTDDRKRLTADLASTSGCGAYVGNVTRLRALAASAAANPGGNGGLNGTIATVATALANQALAPFVGFACVANSVTGDYAAKQGNGEWSGTAVLSYRPLAGVMTYASFSRGYKAGGFNLDAAPLFNSSTLVQQPFNSLAFKPETVDSWEIGAKYAGRGVTLSVALFYELFDNFQLNTYNGLNFFVSNIQGCKTSLGNTDSDAVTGNSACADTKSGVTSKGVELEASAHPLRDLTLGAGFTYADARYRHDLAGSPDPITGNNSLQPTLFLLPGNTLSNAPKYVATASASFTPMVGDALKALIYSDIRYTGRMNTASDLFVEKEQKGFSVVNARLGLGRPNGRWSVELWAQNLFNTSYQQIAFNMPLQGGGTGAVPGTAAAVKAFGTSSTQLFGAFLGEPRTFGGTLKTRF